MSEAAPLALSLTIRNATKLENGSPILLVLDRRSATIGRANSTDWPLPDPDLHISSRHCDVLFRNGGYELVDNSTNGTFINDAPVERPAAVLTTISAALPEDEPPVVKPGLRGFCTGPVELV